MKTFAQRWKYYLGLCFAAVLVFSSLFVIIPAPAKVAAQQPSDGKCVSVINPSNGSQLDPDCIPGAGAGTGCTGSQAPSGTNCDTIPDGCPGSGTNTAPNPGAPLVCPFLPTNTAAWTCPATSCNFGGSVTLQQGQQAQNQTGGATSADSSTGCDFSGNPLTWVICPVVGMLETGVRQIDKFIMSSLEFDTVAVFDTNPGYKQAWSSFRLIASAILIIAGLIMVSSQALGFEFLDAYTVKKSLPKILIAALFINLSWIGMRYVIEFFNVFGFNIRELIYSPFSNLGGTLGGSTLFTAGVGAIAALAFLGPMALLTFLATALLAVIVGFIIIIVRNLALVVIIILAPVAIACWVLPNTQKVWNLWKDNFLGLLLLFPIISTFIAVGRVFSAVSLSSAQGGTNTTFAGTVAQIVGFVAYFIPYFILPVAFRLATGVIGTIAGVVNDRNKGAFDRLKKYRGNKMAENSAAMGAGTRFNNKFGNTLTSRAANVASSPLTLGASRKGRQAYQQKIDAASLADAKGRGSAIMFNDDALRVGTYGSEAHARANFQKDYMKKDADGTLRSYSDEEMETAIAANKAAGGFGRARQVYAAKQLAATGTGYDNLEQVAQTIARVSNGDASQAAALAGNINSETKKAGRYDLAPGFGKLNDLAQSELSGGTNRPTQATYDAAKVQAVRGADPVTQLRGKTSEMKNHAAAMVNHAQRQYNIAQTATDAGVRDTAMRELVSTLGTIEQYDQSKSYASIENQGVVNDMVNKTRGMRVAIDPHITPTALGYDRNTGKPIQGPVRPGGEYVKEWQQASAPRQYPNDPNRQS